MRATCNDIDIAWFEWGRGEPLVLVHGLADDHRAWRKTLAWLLWIGTSSPTTCAATARPRLAPPTGHWLSSLPI